MATPKLIKIDRNGTKYWADDTCQRCGGRGERSEWYYTGLTCFECGGTGKSKVRITKEYTDEYLQKLEDRRKAKQAKWEAEHPEEVAEQKRQEEERVAYHQRELERLKAEEERREAEKARSQFVGTVGEKITVKATYLGSPYFDRNVFGKSERTYIHQFSVDGNKLVWMTGSYKNIPEEAGTVVELTGTVKDHNEYKGEKQTSLLRCKIS